MKLSQIILGVAAALFVSAGCMDQYDPSPEHKLFEQERKNANKPQPKLDKNGKMPVVEKKEVAANVNPIDAKYDQLCASCHGADGAANSPAALALNPKPRAFTDKKWQASVDDAKIAKVIKDGGASVGLSPTMAPWGALLNDDELKGLVEKVRSFGK